MQAVMLLILIVALIVSIFAVQNSSPVQIKFLTWTYADISLVVVIIGSFLSGMILSTLFNLIRSLKQKIRINELHMQLQTTKMEHDNLAKKLAKYETRQQKNPNLTAKDHDEQSF